jgi:hypothetical protein
MGSVMKWALLSRERVEDDPEIAFIFEGIWERKDHDWADYISLSISRINLDLFQRSRRHFPDYWWAVMSFDASILDHEGVYFTTTNNSYPCCKREPGVEGFNSMFKSPVEWGWYGSRIVRPQNHPDGWPTDRAAEVLYPRCIPLDFLERIYVPGQQHRRLVNAWCESFGRPGLPVDVDLEPFS